MEYITPEDNYLVVFPDGRGVTFKDIEGSDAYINRYYEERIRLHAIESIYEDYDLSKEDSRERISTILGAEEGDPKIYYLDDVFEAIQNSGAFIEEQEEIMKWRMGLTDNPSVVSQFLLIQKVNYYLCRVPLSTF